METSLLEDLWAATLGVAVLYIVYLVGLGVYRLTLDPISHLPGPWLAKATYLPAYYHQLKGDIPYWILELHQQYGDAVRYSPVRISFANPQAFKDIYGWRNGHKYSLPKEPIDYADIIGGDALGSYLDDGVHASRRKMFNHAFSERSVQSQEPMLREYVDLLVNKLKQKASMKSSGDQALNEKVDMVLMYNCTTFDFMAELAFGRNMGLLQAGKYNSWTASVFNAIKAANALNVLKQFQFIKLLLEYAMPPALRKMEKEFFQYSVDMVNTRLAEKTDRPDIWTHVLKKNSEKDASEALSLFEMHTNGQFMMLAGTETTATLLAGMTYLLLKNPECMEQLQAELRSTFSDSEFIAFAALPKLPYLNGCIQEAFRLYPPAPSGPQRRTPPEGAEICGRSIPAGYTVSCPAYATAHWDRYWKDPREFRPERWFDSAYDSDQKAALQPFLQGPRNCLGQTLAMHEARLMAAKTFWHLDLALCPESDKWLDRKMFLLWQKTPLMVTVEGVRD